MTHKKVFWKSCTECQGRGNKRRKVRKKTRLRYQIALAHHNENPGVVIPVRPKGDLYTCPNCNGSGLVLANQFPQPDTENYPHIAIIGGGIGGMALAVACLHRGIPFTLYERDLDFDSRSQGYGLTLQQASKAIKGFGIETLEKGVVSTKHMVHTTEGKVIGEWGMRKWLQSDKKALKKPSNIHIARQSLRLELLEQLGDTKHIQWGHQLINFTYHNTDIQLNFEVNGKLKSSQANLIVGADGIRSTVRKFIIGEKSTPLRYLGCIVILGICPLQNIKDNNHALLDSATVFQTANGNERIYMMPFDATSIMWQLSFPMTEAAAKELSTKGTKALKLEAMKRTQWHTPIPQIMEATVENQISGYPVYDRQLLQAELLCKHKQVTLLGDAAHPMSPFKGQGANQALLDALSLARTITQSCRPLSNWREKGIRESVLNDFEAEMITRSASKVKDSADAAEFLHSEGVLHNGNEPRRKQNT